MRFSRLRGGWRLEIITPSSQAASVQLQTCRKALPTFLVWLDTNSERGFLLRGIQSDWDRNEI